MHNMRKYLPKFTNGGDMLEKQRNVGLKVPSPNPIKGTIQATKKYGSGIPPTRSFSEVQVDTDAKKQILKEQRKQNRAQGNSVGLSEKGLSTMGNIASAAGGINDILGSMVNADENSSFKQQQMVGDALLKSGNPYAMIVGAAFKTFSATDQALGINMNTISKSEAKATGISGAGRLLNNIAGFLPGTGLGVLAGTTDTVKMSDETKQLSNAFSGSVDDISTAEGMSGGRYLVGKNKINGLIREAQRNDRIIADLGRTNTTRRLSDYGQDLAQQNLNRFAGNNYQNVHIGKKGLKLISADEIRKLLEQQTYDIKSFHNGGVIGVDVNVIAEGKYHAHKNHLGDVSDEFGDLTKKGIPVVTREEGGEIQQIAEIEKKELIFRLEVTNKLEELYKDGSDEAAIEAGKLLAIEICENTQDNSGEVLKDE